MDARLMHFYTDVIQTAESVIGHPAVNLPDTELDMVKLEALGEIVEQLRYAVRHADEAKTLAKSKVPEDNLYLKEINAEYAKAQVEIAMNLNAIKANVEGITS